MTLVRAYRGPLAGRRVEIPEGDVKAATNEKSGWAHTLEPGDIIREVEPNFPFDRRWKIPGYEPPPEAAGEAKDAAKEAAKETAKETAKDAKEPAKESAKTADEGEVKRGPGRPPKPRSED